MRDQFAEEPFNQYLLLRNIIRGMGLPCLLCGAETSLLTVYYFGRGSRRESRKPWARLLTQLPLTSLSGGRTNLTGRCRGYEKRMLQNTRPLLVQWFAACLSRSAVDGNRHSRPRLLDACNADRDEAPDGPG